MDSNEDFETSFCRLKNDIRSYLIGNRVSMTMLVLVPMFLYYFLIYLEHRSQSFNIKIYGLTFNYSDISPLLFAIGILVFVKLNSFLTKKYLPGFGLKDFDSLNFADGNKIIVNRDSEEAKKINRIEKILLYLFLSTVFLVLIFLFIRGWNYNYIYYLVISVFGLLYCLFLIFVVIHDKQRFLRLYISAEPTASETAQKENLRQP